MAVMDLFRLLSVFSLDTSCIYLLHSLIISFVMCSLSFGRTSCPRWIPGLDSTSYKASLGLCVGGNATAPQQKLDHCGSFGSFSLQTASVGRGPLLVLGIATRSCGEREWSSSWANRAAGWQVAGLQSACVVSDQGSAPLRNWICPQEVSNVSTCPTTVNFV